MNRNHPSAPWLSALWPARPSRCVPCSLLRPALRALVMLAATLLAVASTPSGPAWAADKAAARTNPPLQLVYRTVTLP